jgi:hypothetical protein
LDDGRKQSNSIERMANPLEIRRVQGEQKNPHEKELSTDEKDRLSLDVKALTSSGEARQPFLSVGSLADDLSETGWPPREGTCATGMFNYY